MPNLTTLLLTDAIEEKKYSVDKAGDDEDDDKQPRDREDAPPEPEAPPPPIGEVPAPKTKEQVASDKLASKARDLKHRAKEASYNALELDNSRENHAKAADAHQAAAKASEKALHATTNPKEQAEFRASQHSHLLHAAYHDKMSHSSDEERKASANAGKQVHKAIGLAWIEKQQKDCPMCGGSGKKNGSMCKMCGGSGTVAKGEKRKDWDHLGAATARAHGLTGRARAAEKDPKLGDPKALHRAAAVAHAAAAESSSGDKQQRHLDAATYHRSQANGKAKAKCTKAFG